MPSAVTKFVGLFDKREFLLDLADSAHNFLLNWLQRYPPIKTQDFFMPLRTTTCGAGFVYDQHKDIQIYVNHLKGFMVGNPEADYYYDYSALPRYVWTCYVRPNLLYFKAKQV
ncbi:hypothetical protein SLA2020_019070 [Shorea laevis]